MRDFRKLSDVIKGLKVVIDSRNGAKEGVITSILTTRDNEKGIKVELDTGDKGRILQILEDEPIKIEEGTKPTIEIEENITKPIIIEIDEVLGEGKEKMIDVENQRKFEVVTKFFQSAYCKVVKSDIYGIVIFKVNAIEISIAIYKINMFLKKYCLTTDLKYEVIKVNS